VIAFGVTNGSDFRKVSYQPIIDDLNRSVQQLDQQSNQGLNTGHSWRKCENVRLAENGRFTRNQGNPSIFCGSQNSAAAAFAFSLFLVHMRNRFLRFPPQALYPAAFLNAHDLGQRAPPPPFIKFMS
jgi:hypothetical protein